MINSYAVNLKNNLPRLMGLLDRNPLSKTYGSFDRSFWHLRRTDFSSSAAQQGCLVLAQAAALPDVTTSETEKENLRKLARAALQFTFSLQHSDGSLDEWYPQERGWAGPTGYVLYSVVRSLELLQENAAELHAGARAFAEKAVQHLLCYEELDVLSNHQAMALLAVESAAHFFQLKIDEGLRQNLWKRFYESFCDEGWSLEYDGCDPGYQSATLSFMARLHRYVPEQKLLELAKSQIEFLQSFVFPDLSFAGNVGTRGTANVFFYAFEYWGAYFAEAQAIARQMREGLKQGQIIRPEDQEDHYLIYRLVEMAECGALNVPDAKPAPWSRPSETKFWPKAGIIRISTPDYYGVFNLKKGGTGKLFKLGSEPQLVFSDSGYLFQTSNKKLFVTSFLNSNAEISVKSGEVTVTTRASFYKRPVFSAITFLLFRFALLFTRHSKIALYFKSKIRKSIMVKFNLTDQIELKRTFKFAGAVEVQDFVSTKNIQLKAGLRGFDFPSRVVPQSLYATPQQAMAGLYSELSHQDLADLNSKNNLNIKVL